MERSIDWHCDVLYKMVQDETLDFYNDPRLDVTVQSLRKGGIKAQACAIFIDPDISYADKYQNALAQIQAFNSRILTQPHIVHIKHFSEIHDLKPQEIGVFLTLEGLDCVGCDLDKVKFLVGQGVLSIGMTWNDANLACDGIGEPRGAGLSQFGFDVVSYANDHHVFIDVSHISLQGFEDVMETAKYVIASHSNAQAIASHRRNLSDKQIKQMVEKGGLIHLVYCDAFVKDGGKSTMLDLKKHIDHFRSLGATHLLGLGSDFDGITEKVEGLEHAGHTTHFLNLIETEYGAKFRDQIASLNFLKYVEKFSS